MTQRIGLGRISGVFGTSGWVKVYSLTSPSDNIFDYQPWHTDRAPGRLRVEQWQRRGPRLVARLVGIDCPEAAERLVGAELYVPRDQLPEPESGRFYWHDLVGLAVRDAAGASLGRVAGLIDVGPHDVLQIDAGDGRPPVLVPFVMHRYVLEVDVPNRRLVVDWDPAWLASDTP